MITVIMVVFGNRLQKRLLKKNQLQIHRILMTLKLISF